jgi:glucose-6-phosphate isomerase, archaeal
MKSEPFCLTMELSELQALPGAQAGVNRLSKVRDHFADQQEVMRILQLEDPIIYEFTSIKRYDSSALLSLGITVICPGKVGDEFFMTKGHFHDREHDGDEVYYVQSGIGRLLLQSWQGDFKILEMKPGMILYTPSSWAHRTVNTGNENLVFLSIWPAVTEYDYQLILDRGGFPKRIIERNHVAVAADNQKFKVLSSG